MNLLNSIFLGNRILSARGITTQAIETHVPDQAQLLDDFACPEKFVIGSYGEEFAPYMLIPADVSVHGLIFRPKLRTPGGQGGWLYVSGI